MTNDSNATTEPTHPAAVSDISELNPHEGPGSVLERLLAPLASIRLTIMLLGLAIFLIFAGTLAQVDAGIWHVIKEYFRSWFVWIDFQVFLPRSEIKDLDPSTNLSSYGFWFPAGRLIGTALAINLCAAHLLRFKVRARGLSLATGLLLIAIGIAATVGVIASGNNSEFQGELSDRFARIFWHGFRALLAGLWLAATVALLSLRGSKQTAWWLLLGGAQILGVGAILLLIFPSARLDASDLRILWQLSKASGAGLILFAGCLVLFKQKGGIVLLHGGIALLMLGELLVSLRAEESLMFIPEHGSTQFVRHDRLTELALITDASAGEDQVTVVPQHMLETNRDRQVTGSLSGPKLVHAALPCAMRVLRFYPNSRIVPLDQVRGERLGNRGSALEQAAEELPLTPGTASQAGDQPAAYVALYDQKTGASLGTYLLHVGLAEQAVTIHGKPYRIALRFARTYKPYTMTLKEFHFDRYVGTNTPKNFSSDLRLVDLSRNVDRDVTISMNNPLRYAGETFYQSSFTANGTVLSVVANRGWMIPYVACMLTSIGLLAQFGQTLVRFLKQRHAAIHSIPTASLGSRLIPVLLVLGVAGYLGSRIREPATASGQLRLVDAARIPVAYEGRVKPLDTVARNSLRIISNRESFHAEIDRDGKTVVEKRAPIEWLFDVIANTPAARKHKIVRIEGRDVLDTLGLERRHGLRYSIDEIARGLDGPAAGKRRGFFGRIAEIRAKEEKNRTASEKNFLEAWYRINHYQMLAESFQIPNIREAHVDSDVRSFIQLMEQLQRIGVHAIPPATPDGTWELLPKAEVSGLVLHREIPPAAQYWRSMLAAYAENDPAKFNTNLAQYRNLLRELESDQAAALASDSATKDLGRLRYAEQLKLARTDFEASLNRFNPFLNARIFYLFAFLLACAGWLGWNHTLHRAALWLLVLTFVLHTAALAARIYISGRPPATNLESSALLVGWGCVALGIILECIYGMGLGSVVAAISGFVTLLIYNALSFDGDTIKVMRAVLDTNFWLATHVVCILLGYATTFVAGLFGLLYVLGSVFYTRFGARLRNESRITAPCPLSPTGRGQGEGEENPHVLFESCLSNLLTRMTYGTLCFALFFSFVGTVLGGLWADDSWGRFWGWDVKENGALIIVLWITLVLHARLGRLIGSRGLAILAIGGNIVTCWSWFGVNALEVGLHSYGFDRSTVRWLVAFVASQLFVIAIGLLPGTARRNVAVHF